MRLLRQATRHHYEEFPFLLGGPERVELWSRRMRTLLPNELVAGALILDVGAGSGETTAAVTERGGRVVCLDLTWTAVRRTRVSNPRSLPCQADALALPFADGTFDHGVAMGVLHHTPDCRQALAELARVVRGGGRLVVLLYSRWTLYHLGYVLTAPLRARSTPLLLDRLPGWAIAVLRALVRLNIRQRLDDTQLRNLLADQFWTPVATFHTPAEIRRWAAALRLRPVARHWIPGYANIFLLERASATADQVPARLRSATRKHYETFPFVAGGERRIRHWQRRLTGLLPDTFPAGTRVLDAGCGSAEIAQAVARRGADITCVDLTSAAARKAQGTAGVRGACQADVLALPFGAETFGHVVSIGVLHHTPDAARGFAELARVVAPGGRIVVLLYARWTPYHLAYRLAAPLRRLPVESLHRLPRWLLSVTRTIVRLQVGQRLEDPQLKALLADQLWTPQTSFHSYRELRRWASEHQLRVCVRKPLWFHANLVAFAHLSPTAA